MIKIMIVTKPSFLLLNFLLLYYNLSTWVYTFDYALPCSEISTELRFPCQCALKRMENGDIILENGQPLLIINCDRIVFLNNNDSASLFGIPYGAPVVSYMQRWSGHQSMIPNQIFTSNLPIEILDLSFNAIRKLNTDGLQFRNLQNSLTELKLSNNLLGDDTLNPIFSTTAFRAMKFLQLLDLSANGIKSIEEGILEGCDTLQELYLDENEFDTIPGTSLNGPKALKVLSLKGNNIEIIKTKSFNAQMNLETIDLNSNLISIIENGAFLDLHKIEILRLSHNKFTKFNSDVFDGAENLKLLDLSDNFLSEFPAVAFKAFHNLHYLNLSSNLIQNLESNHLNSLGNLYELNLSRNSLASINSGTFSRLKQLKKLDISVNSLRTVEDNAFEGLNNLQFLNLQDNNILLIPAVAFQSLPHLVTLQLDYNRITALSSDIFDSIANKITNLMISTNVVRELPSHTFQQFQHLQQLDLKKNLISTLNLGIFIGLEHTLKTVSLAQNRIINIIQSDGKLMPLKALETFDLSSNYLTDLSDVPFDSFVSLKHFNLSNNQHLGSVPNGLLYGFEQLEIIDLSHCGIRKIPSDFFLKSNTLQEVYLAQNALMEIPEKFFANMPNLTRIDLSFNNITSIKQAAFSFIMNIKSLNLKGNRLASFKGEYFNTGTSLEMLDISENQLTYLFPSAFRIHPRLKQLIISKNKINVFPAAELIANLQFLEYIDLSYNQLKSINELDFAKLPRLRSIILQNNNLEEINEMAFHNSTQLQIFDFSNNRLERLGERTFEGLIRIELLNLANNRLSDLPENIFERVTKMRLLENLNLRGNRFDAIPFQALESQSNLLNSLDLAYNAIEHLPLNNEVMINIKELDISYNPLTQQSIINVISEPKTVRRLNMAATGIGMEIAAHLETPFLKYLNLSYNNISNLMENMFERTTLLQEFDISNNKLTTGKIWTFLGNLKMLNISNNPIRSISNEDFAGLNKLRHLSMHSLSECTNIGQASFRSVPNLFTLNAYGYPKLGYMDIRGILQNIPNILEKINVEIKDSAIGKDQLQSILNGRLKELSIIGTRVKSISSGTLSGIRASHVIIRLRNTSITSLPSALFFPLPRSSKTILDINDNQITTLNIQLLLTLEDRRGDLKLIGLENNPIVCDCNAKALRRWIPSYYMMNDIVCDAPEYVAGKRLIEIAENELTCDPNNTQMLLSIVNHHQSSLITQPPLTSILTDSTKRLMSKKKTTELDIIWSIPSTEKLPSEKVKATSIGGGGGGGGGVAATGQSTLNNDDTLIIGIVGGVVAFIAILIIIICIVRLKMSNNRLHPNDHARTTTLGTGSIMTPGTGIIGSGSSCTCSVIGVQQSGGNMSSAIYALPPNYAQSAYNLPIKMSTIGQSGNVRMPNIAYSTLGRGQVYAQQQQNGNNIQPYFIATNFPSTEEKIYR